MGIPETHSETKKYDIQEPVLFEYNYRLPIPLRIGAAILALGLIIGPILLMVFNEQMRSNLPDNFIFIFILIPGLFNLIFYKRTYIFTNRGIYILGKQKGKAAGNGSPVLLMEWGDYDRFKRTILGFKIYNKVKVEEYWHTDNQQGLPQDISNIVLGSGAVKIRCNSEDQSQVEYFLISRNIHPGEIG